MRLRLFIARLLLKIKFSFKGPVFYRLAFFLCLSFLPLLARASLKIAVVDTGFCPRKIVSSKNIQLRPALDMTDSVKLDCKLYSSTSPRFHGQLVLEEFLKYAPKSASMTIFPLIVYNEKGQQTEAAWKKTLEWIAHEKIDLVLTASGLLQTSSLSTELPSVWFAPSGRIEGVIKAETKLFPQSLAPLPNLFLIGDYFDGKQIIADQNLLYQRSIDYFFPSGEKNLMGTSRAVAHALGRAIEVCSLHKKMLEAEELRLCLLKSQKILTDSFIKKEIKTF